VNALEILNPGVHCTLQDEGRLGYGRYGLARGGAMDLRAYRWANKLLDNPAGAATLELISGGLRARCHGCTQVAITGAEAAVTVNGHAVPMWQTLLLNEGDELAIGHSRRHRFIYLALAGGIRGPALFGSRSVVVREGFSETPVVQAGDRVEPAGEASDVPARTTPAQARAYLAEPPVLRFIPGYQYQDFSRADILRLTTQTYQVTGLSDRMGFRLEGQALVEPPPGIISEGLCPGAIQIPGDGQPIVLMADSQTIGGYPKPGVVCRLDLGRLAQQLPGGRVYLQETDLATAQNQRRLFELYFRKTQWREDGKSLAWQ